MSTAGEVTTLVFLFFIYMIPIDWKITIFSLYLFCVGDIRQKVCFYSHKAQGSKNKALLENKASGQQITALQITHMSNFQIRKAT